MNKSDFSYEPSQKQIQSFAESNSKINIWVGAVRSGKTYISLWRFITELSEGEPGEYALITRTYDSFNRNILPLMQNMLGIKDVEWKSGHRQLHIFGKRIHVIGADDERAEAKIRGPTFQGAYVDELTIIPQSVFVMLISRCGIGSAKIFATTNPDSSFHWVKTDFLDNNPDVRYWDFTLDDNPSISEEDRDYLRRQYKGLWYQRFIEGKWVQAEGAVYDTFDEKFHVIDIAPSYTPTYLVGIDYGTTNPCAFVLLGYDPARFPRLWVHDEYYYDSRAKQRQKTDAEYADDLAKFIEGKPVKAVYIDPSAVSFRLELQKRGLPALYEAKNNVEDGIRFVNQKLNDGAFKVLRHCKHVINEFQSYVWDEKAAIRGVEKPKKENDHALDAIRYALYSHFFHSSGQELSAADLERSYREAMGESNLPRMFQDDHFGMF